jgi:hypothetical protein
MQVQDCKLNTWGVTHTLLRLPLCISDVPVLAAVPPQGRRAAWRRTRTRAATTIDGAGVDVEPLVPHDEGPLGAIHLGLPPVRRPIRVVHYVKTLNRRHTKVTHVIWTRHL